MSSFDRHTERSHDIIAEVLDGKDTVTEAQRKTALAILSGDVKEKQAISGKAARVIGLVKHVRLPETREQIALTALRELLHGTFTSGPVVGGSPASLATGGSTTSGDLGIAAAPGAAA